MSNPKILTAGYAPFPNHVGSGVLYFEADGKFCHLRGLTKFGNDPWALLRDMFAARLSQLTRPQLSQHAMRVLHRDP
jgi:hypothetical protein